MLGSYFTWEDRALIPGTDASLADILIPNRSGGKDTALDITVVNPLQAALVPGAATTPGHALMRRYEEIMSKLGEGYRLTGMVFISQLIPLGVA